MNLVIAIALAMVGATIYCLPMMIAAWRKHHRRHAIAIVDFSLGWTLIGWIVALAWSLSTVQRERRRRGAC
jgi:hypothetical protein